MSESEVLRSLRLDLGKRDDLVLWRNNVGVAWYGIGGGPPRCSKCSAGVSFLNLIPVRYGLCPGSSDLIGIHVPTGRFVAVEAKYGKGELTDEQERFIMLVRRNGGIATEARSSDDVTRLL